MSNTYETEMVNSKPRQWPEVRKNTFREAIECPLKLVCYLSCAWWKDGKCIFQERLNRNQR